MDLASKISDRIAQSGGKILCSQLVADFQPNVIRDNDWKRLFKKAVASVAVIEQGEDKKKYLVLKEVAKNKENITNIKSVFCQSTQTPISQMKCEPTVSRRTSNRTAASSSSVQSGSSNYSAYTSKEPRQWWIACSEGRLADMQRLLGLNPKLVNWSNPVDGWTALHYAAKTSNIQSMRLLIKQYHANVNAPCRNGQTPLHIAVMHSNVTAIRQLVEEFKANTAIMDFSGRFPVSLLSSELREQFEALLTAGHLARIRDALQILRPKHTKCDGESTSFLLTGSDSVDFKRPVLVPKSLAKRDTLYLTHITDVLRAPSLRSSTLSLSEGYSRRPSAFMNLIHSAANAVHVSHDTAVVSRLSTPSPSLQFQRERSMLLIHPSAEMGNSKSIGRAPSSSLDSSSSSDIVTTAGSSRSLTENHELSHASLLHRKLPKYAPGQVNPTVLVTLLSLLPPSPPGPEKKHHPRKFRNGKCPSALTYTAALAESNIHTLASNIRRKHSVKSLTYDVESLCSDRVPSSPSCQSLAAFSSPAARGRSIDYTPGL
ncbi:unnamed protein product [Dicrocoelium dendriticum]|nr:unnamed protein product [Dicrocoelium dendriticum]